MPAKAGVIAPCDVWVRVGPTYQDPGKIGDFQRIGIQVKAIKGSLEVVKDFKLCSKGDLVSATVSHMCRLLNIIPFEYAMEVKLVYNQGTLIPKAVVQLNSEDVLTGLTNTVRDLTACSLEAGLPNTLAVPHMLREAFTNMLFLGAAADLKFEALEKALNSAAQAKTEAPAKVEEAKEEEVEEEEESESIGGLFD